MRGKEKGAMSNKRSPSTENGWTLLEIVVVAGIIASLCVLGLPTLAAYKASSFDSRAKNDLVAAAIAQETYYIDWFSYSGCADVATCDAVLPEFEPSDGVEIGVTTITNNHFVMTARHPKGSITFTWNSQNKGLQE